MLAACLLAARKLFVKCARIVCLMHHGTVIGRLIVGG